MPAMSAEKMIQIRRWVRTSGSEWVVTVFLSDENCRTDRKLLHPVSSGCKAITFGLSGWSRSGRFYSSQDRTGGFTHMIFSSASVRTAAG